MVLNGFSDLIIGAQNQLPITFCLDIVCNKTLKAKKSTPTHTISNLQCPYCTLNPNKKLYENSLQNAVSFDDLFERTK